EVAHDLLAGRLVPTTALTSDDVDAGVLLEDFHRASHTRFVGRMPDKALDDHDVAFATELVGQPLGADASPLGLVDDHVVDAFRADLLVNGDHHNALGSRFFQVEVQPGHITRVDDDGIHPGVDQVLDLLLLIGDVRVGALLDQVHLDTRGVDLRHRVLEVLDHLRAPLAAHKAVRDPDREWAFAGCSQLRHARALRERATDD